MLRHYANVIDELVGEPKLSAEEQIKRARRVVVECPKPQVDKIIVDLFQPPTVTQSDEQDAASFLFGPKAIRLDSGR